MIRITRIALYASLILSFGPTAAQEPAAAPDPAHTWDLTEIYASEPDWDAARKDVLAELENIISTKGKLGDSADSLYQALDQISDTSRKASRVYSYASLKADEDLRETADQERRQLAQSMFAQLGEATSWVQPEILRVGEETIESYMREDPRLQRFAYQLGDILRNAPHTLGDEAEATLAYFSQSFSAPSSIYSMVANSDIPWPEVEFSTGQTARIDAQGYSRYRASPIREDRKQAFDAFWGKWQEYRNTTGTVINAHLQTQVALAKARHFDSVLERELFQDNLPPEIYRTLVAEVNKGLPTLHRYFGLRQRMLGLDDLHYYDLYPPLVSLDKEFDFDTSKAITLEAMSTLGNEWVERQTAAMSQRWMHVHPQRGKRSGAYMNPGAYDVHPFVLLNHNDDYVSLSTMAHEWGHAMHTLYAAEAQPFDTANYAIFLAEIPSTSLELVLQDYMVKNAESDEERLFYLGSALESLRTTFFRQTMFAEFELALYEAVERGEALSGEGISEMYGELLRRYHGHDAGVVQIADLYINEWMFVPHFYYNMYVFQYATSQTAGTALYENIVEEGQPAIDNFKTLLRAGGSDYPNQILLRAGVDLASPEPYRAVIRKMNAIMDEMESILAES
ncbi:MAG: oligoendopeptidase F [Xanthomonadales bacterium]|nr:oligoendopeptidase F [Xanthomonadales bacterium]NNL05027.1 oligoendopeptidase F [Xanthomonadales bacterium]